MAARQRTFVSLESAEREIRASLGLHRGRRVLGFMVLAVIGVALRLAWQDEPPVVPPTRAVEPNTPPTASQANRAPVRRRALGTQTHRVPPLQAAAVASARTVEPTSTLLAPPTPAPELSDSLELEVARPEPPPQPPPEPEAPADSDERGDARAASIARAIAQEKRAAVRACYEHELKQQPELTGTVVVELQLAAPDRIEALRVRDDLNRPEFTRCVTAAMQGVHFATLDEDLSVEVPYTLQAVLH